jgi:hypothetical protein
MFLRILRLTLSIGLGLGLMLFFVGLYFFSGRVLEYGVLYYAMIGIGWAISAGFFYTIISKNSAKIGDES